ncbi:MAG TPA: hypothetical protein VLE93_03640 [Candidatus Saccharimonadales bacterium]|nr:hypothetical protein [Candidatus Saccharimonadales bacterium]
MPIKSKFHIGVVLALITGVIVSDEHNYLGDIFCQMTGRGLTSNEWPHAAKPCRASLLQQYPILAKSRAKKEFAKMCRSIKVTDQKERQELLINWLPDFQATFGLEDMLEVEALPPGSYERVGAFEATNRIIKPRRIEV